MALLKKEDKEKLKKLFSGLKNEVRIILFTQEMECEYCKHARQMLKETAALSKKVKLKVYDFVKDKDKADSFGIDKIPAVVIMGEKDYGIRFFGIPAGYEFTTLIEDILDVGRGEHGLPAEIVDELAKIDKPVHMQVMISPTCPYCPKAVRTAHRFAMASDMIRGDMVEVSEFPFLVQKYNIQGVPNTIVNEEHSVLGALPEKEVLEKIREILAGGPAAATSSSDS